MKFHIVVPSLNQGRYIADAIKSSASQGSVGEVEITVMDGVSDDGSVGAAQKAASAFPGVRIRVISEPDEGQSDAINKGISLGSGEIVGWLNADDRLLPGALERVRQLFIDHPDAVVVYGDVRYIDETGNPLHDLREQDFHVDDLLWGPCYIPQPSTFVARWAWQQVGGVRTDLHYAMDLDLWLRLSELGEIVHVSKVLSEFRVHPRSKTVESYEAARREAREVRRQNVCRKFGRTPTTFELEVRHFAVRARRRARRAFRIEEVAT